MLNAAALFKPSIEFSDGSEFLSKFFNVYNKIKEDLYGE